MKKLFVLILIVFSFSLYSQKYTYVLTNENAIAKDNVTKQIKDQSIPPFKVYLTLTTYGGGSVVIENGAVIMLTQQYDRNDVTQDYHYRGVDDAYLNCSVHLNTKYEETKGVIYMSIEFQDITFFYKLLKWITVNNLVTLYNNQLIGIDYI